MPPDFKHFAYVNPDAPKGGLLSLQITTAGGNQNFETFDTLNIFSKKGDGAAGMTATFDTLMAGNGDEPDSVYGLARASPFAIAPDKLHLPLPLRPEARFTDGSPLTAADVAFSLKTLKEKGHPDFRDPARASSTSASAEADDVVAVRFIKQRSRDAHLIVAGMPIFSEAWWKSRDFDAPTLEAPLGSGPYKVDSVRTGPLHRIRAR